MHRQDFHYDLPSELIAHQPAAERRGSRLLCLDGPTGEISHRQFANLPELVEPGDLLVFNDTRVIPARLFGHKASGGKVEILVERLLADDRVLAHVRASKSPKPQSGIVLEDGTEIRVEGRQENLFELVFPTAVASVLERLGHMPLPPYIERADTDADKERYQTVYNRNAGAVAAPTAGLHFDEAMLAELEAAGVQLGWVTLHVGAGTFAPVRAEAIRDHHMHSEYMEISDELCDKVLATRAAGKRVIAVGTTSVRCLESAARHAPAGQLLAPYCGDTDIFIFPGYRFQVIDALVTNFHLPESTLIMLVSAFAGYHQTFAAYERAVSERYRFFSYGDAMFITRNPEAALDVPDEEKRREEQP